MRWYTNPFVYKSEAASSSGSKRVGDDLPGYTTELEAASG